MLSFIRKPFGLFNLFFTLDVTHLSIMSDDIFTSKLINHA